MYVGLLLTSPGCAGRERPKHANQEFVVSAAGQMFKRFQLLSSLDLLRLGHPFAI